MCARSKLLNIFYCSRARETSATEYLHLGHHSQGRKNEPEREPSNIKRRETTSETILEQRYWKVSSLSNVCVFVQLTHRPTRTENQLYKKPKHFLTWDFPSALYLKHKTTDDGDTAITHMYARMYFSVCVSGIGVHKLYQGHLYLQMSLVIYMLI